MLPEQRREKIIRIVREKERVSVDFLAEQLNSSRETIRRDLTELDARGLVRKFHGGASAAEPASYEPSREGPFVARLHENTRAKRMIAQRAAALFRPGDTLLVDTGTTTFFFAEELARCEGLTVITNSATIASLASRGENSHVFLIGGEFREAGMENVGPLAVEQLRHFHAHHAVLTVGAISENGFMDFDLLEAEVARAMIDQAKTVTILADASKLGKEALFQICPLETPDRLVTDTAVDNGLNRLLREKEVEVIVATTLP